MCETYWWANAPWANGRMRTRRGGERTFYQIPHASHFRFRKITWDFWKVEKQSFLSMILGKERYRLCFCMFISHAVRLVAVLNIVKGVSRCINKHLENPEHTYTVQVYVHVYTCTNHPIYWYLCVTNNDKQILVYHWNEVINQLGFQFLF
mgnify:CR=1 FL=1